MAKTITEKIKITQDALASLNDAIELYQERIDSQAGSYEEKLEFALRDSMIQRFEYCTDLLWKLIKAYLQDVQKMTLQSLSPKPIIRDAVEDGLLTEKEAGQLLAMVDTRNKTSHIYHQETAELIAQEIPSDYQRMKQIADRVAQKIVGSGD